MQIIFDDTEFERVVRNGLTELGQEHQVIICKDHGTEQGNPLVCVSQVAMVANTPMRFQTVMTVRQFLYAAAAMQGRYEHLDLLEKLTMPKDAPDVISGHHRGVGWEAIRMTEVYLINFEGREGLTGIGGNEESARATAAGLIDQLLTQDG